MNLNFSAGDEKFRLYYGTIQDYNTTSQTLFLKSGIIIHLNCMMDKFAAINPNEPVMVFAKSDNKARSVDDVVNIYNVGITAAQFQKISIEMSVLAGKK